MRYTFQQFLEGEHAVQKPNMDFHLWLQDIGLNLLFLYADKYAMQMQKKVYDEMLETLKTI